MKVKNLCYWSNSQQCWILGSANDNNRISPRESEENPFDANIQPPETTNIDNDPFASFGEKVEISDNDLPF